jgi:undecaprenyl-diphosphatase
MRATETVFLGIAQGLTEFLPISSSGHLVLFQNLLGLREPELLLDCALHLGTLVAICIFFRSDLREMTRALRERDLKSPHGSLALAVGVGLIPSALMGLVFRRPIEQLFQSLTFVGLMLMVTGIIVAASRLISDAHAFRERVSILAALAVGTAQGLAILPGISRSGATIVCGLLLGLQRDLAGRYSFLLSIPAIIGAVLLQLNAAALQRVGIIPLLLGFGTAALVGFLALKLLMGLLRKGHLYYFAPYCWALGLLILVWSS